MPSKRAPKKSTPKAPPKPTGRKAVPRRKAPASSKAKATPASKATEKRLKATQKEITRAGKAIAKTGRKLTQAKRETKKQGKQIAKTVKTLGKLRDALGRFISPKKGKGKKNVKSGTKKTVQSKSKPVKRGNPGNTKSRGTNKRQPAKKSTTRKPPKTRQTKPAPVTPPTRKRVYEMRDLPESAQNVIFNGTIEDLREVSPEYDDLLKPGEIWGFRFGVGARSGYSYSTFSNFNLLLNNLETYRVIDEFGDDPVAYDDLLGMVKIIRYKAPVKRATIEDSKSAWQGRKQAELGRHHEKFERREAKRKAREKVIRDTKREIKAEKKKRQQLQDEQEKTRKAAEKQRQELLFERAARQAAERKLARLEKAEVARIHEQVKRLPRRKKK